MAEAGFRAAFDGLRRTPAALGAGFLRLGQAPVVAVRGQVSRRDTAQVMPGAPWHIGSITKGVTATLVQQQAMAGLYRLETPLARLLPGHAAAMHPAWRAITLRAALSHTAGLPANFPKAEMRAPFGPDLLATRAARLAAQWRAPLPGTPGAHVYSNMGYVLAGHVVEVHGGAPWEVLVRRDIAAPLGLQTLGLGPPDASGAPWGHLRRFGLTRPVAPDDPRADNPAWLGPAGTVHLSLEDLLRWGAAHLEACKGAAPGFLSAAACQEMHRPVRDGYGLGWGRAPLGIGGQTVTLSGHTGSNGLWMAHLFVVPERDVALALVMNEGWLKRSQAMFLRLARAVLDPE